MLQHAADGEAVRTPPARPGPAGCTQSFSQTSHSSSVPPGLSLVLSPTQDKVPVVTCSKNAGPHLTPCFKPKHSLYFC